MSTRSLTIVKNDNEIKVAKTTQCDGYPSGLGDDLLKMIKRVGLDAIKNSLDNVFEVDQEYIDMVNDTVNWPDVYFWLSRDFTAAKFIEFLTVSTEKVSTIKQESFAADSLFCEWCYVIDFDTNTFEVYKGWNKTPLTEKDRFFYLEPKSRGEYHPVKLKAKFNLNELPDSLNIKE
jgi:hypothetical protein